MADQRRKALQHFKYITFEDEDADSKGCVSINQRYPLDCAGSAKTFDRGGLHRLLFKECGRHRRQNHFVLSLMTLIDEMAMEWSMQFHL